MDANHAHSFWGHSAALDLQELAAAARRARTAADAAECSVVQPGAAADAAPLEEFTCLQVAPGDCRHTALLLGRVGHRATGRVRAYVYEGHMEGLARHMLLLCILFDDSLPLKERAERFLEVHGNAQLREQSGDYLAQRGKLLADVVLACSAGERPAAAGGERSRLLSLFDLSMLRYKERDALVEVFRSYGMQVPFAVSSLRDERMRAFYGERYDARRNVHDYDYHMRLTDAGADPTLIHAAHFREWRDTGLAYQFRDASYPAPNRSLASEVQGKVVAARDCNGKELGRQVLRRGFWADVVNGPYHSFGTWVEPPDAPRLLRKRNKEFIFTAAEVAKHNVTALLHELRTGERYSVPDEYEPPPERDGLLDEDHEPEQAPQVEPGLSPGQGQLMAEARPVSDARVLEDGPLARAALERCRVVFCSGDTEALISKPKLAGTMHAITVGTAHAKLLMQGLEALASENAALAVEGADFVLALKQQQAAEFAAHVASLGASAGWCPLPLPTEPGAPRGHVCMTRA